MNNIKVGDTVKRVRWEHGGMRVGDIGTVTVRETWSSGTSVRLEEFEGTHDIRNLKVITQPVPKEKWTHTDDYGDECFIVHENGSSAWVSYKRYDKDSIVPVNSLEPIKPRITKAQAWDKVMHMHHHHYPLHKAHEIVASSYEVTDE